MWLRMSRRAHRPSVVIAMIIGIIALLGAFMYAQNAPVVASWDRALLHPAEHSSRAPNTPKGLTVGKPRGTTPADGLPAGMVLGYFYDPGNQGNAAQMLQHYLPFLTGIIPFWYTINANGTIAGTDKSSKCCN